MTRWTREVIEDREPVELDEGHPWRGLELRPVWVRWVDTETGRVRWTWRPDGGADRDVESGHVCRDCAGQR